MSADMPATADAGLARRGEALHLRGASAEALALLAAGASRRPGDVSLRLVLARACLEVGRAEEARGWLESALRADPECPAALSRLGEMLPGSEGAPYRARLAAQEPWDEGFVRAARSPAAAETPEEKGSREAPPPPFAFPVRDEEEEPEIEENSAPHIATVTLAEIYFQQGLKEQAAQIYRQLLERQPGDASVRERLGEIEASIAASGSQGAH